MINASALDMIKLALKLAGVLAIGQTPQAEDVNDTLNLLNGMIAGWNQNRWLVYRLVDVACQSTGATTYTVGTGGDFDVFRPDRLNYAYARLEQSSGRQGNTFVDFPLSVIETTEEYAAIRLKQLKSFPSAAYYDATITNGFGTLYVWPIPGSNFELHIVAKEHLTTFDNLTAPITFPPEYYETLLYNLAGRISLLYQLPINPGVIALAQSSLNTLRVANHRVANMTMPSGLMRGGGWATHGIPYIPEGIQSHFTLGGSTLG